MKIAGRLATMHGLAGDDWYLRLVGGVETEVRWQAFFAFNVLRDGATLRGMTRVLRGLFQ